MADVKLPYSTVKKLLVGDSGLHCNPEAVKAFSKIILEKASDLAKAYQESAVADRRKTIMGDKDFTMENTTDEDSEEDADAEEE